MYLLLEDCCCLNYLQYMLQCVFPCALDYYSAGNSIWGQISGTHSPGDPPETKPGGRLFRGKESDGVS